MQESATKKIYDIQSMFYDATFGRLVRRRIAQGIAHMNIKPADRVLDVLDRALRAMGRQPRLVAAVFTSLSSPDPAAVGCQQQITLLMEGIIAGAMGEPAVPDMSERARMIGHVWYSALVGWINGWSTMARVYDELAVSVRLLLPATVAHV